MNSVVSTIAGGTTHGYSDGVGTSSRFNQPRGIALDASGALWVTDQANNRIRKLTFQSNSWSVTTVAGSGVESFSDGTGTNAVFKEPRGCGLDGIGNLWVPETGNHRVRKVSPTGGTSQCLSVVRPSLFVRSRSV
jgi:streptogramin lyase